MFFLASRRCLAVLLLLLTAVSSVQGQERRDARDRYLLERGLRADAADIEAFLTDELSAAGHGNVSGRAEFFAFIMAVHGLDLDKVMRLQAGGIDVIHAMTSNRRPFMEQGLFSDPAIRGEVLGYEDTDEPSDGYGSSIRVKVTDRLKGEATPDTVYLRQRGRFGEGMGPRELVPDVGGQYLLLLSRPMYEYFVWRRAEAGSPAEAPSDHYAVYRYYEADDERVIMGDGSSYEADGVYQELRWLQELIDDL